MMVAKELEELEGTSSNPQLSLSQVKLFSIAGVPLLSYETLHHSSDLKPITTKNTVYIFYNLTMEVQMQMKNYDFLTRIVQMQIIIVAKNANVKLCFLMYQGCANANANDDFLRQQNNFWDVAAIVDHSSFFWYLMILLDDKNNITH